MTIKIKSKVRRMPALRRGRTIRLRTTNARITQNLGGGFRRHILQNAIIPAEGRMTVELEAVGTTRKVVSAGWSLTGGFDPEVFSTENFPFTDSVWRIVIWNDTSVPRTITPYLITKR
ncbi:hypothetical protein [Paenibacillus sedimenti]|uniref:Uncharacterized protein n=1 Tax=Paenibacillus sedimenti TaxID=2770274 RepID=A0A926KSN6_9BACL|nr:hypothetical protein [Paenibacillus sedimenti]MBD0381305.1 hypothetical protein [Paenibacillus sedimenti]